MLVALGVVIAAVSGGVGAYAADEWFYQGVPRWFVGDRPASVYAPDGENSGNLWIDAKRDLNVIAGHIRMQGRDGNFEFESDVGYSHLNAYSIGSWRRVPIFVGNDDGQDVLSLRVRGMRGQTNDVQQWAVSNQVTMAVDGQGRLRIGEVTLTTTVRDGRIVLLGQLPDGTQQVLAAGRP